MTTSSYSLNVVTKSSTSNVSFTGVFTALFAAVSSFAKRHDLALLVDDPTAWASQTTFISTLAELYSGLLEEKVSPRFTLHFVIAQVAAFFTIMPAEMSLLCRFACFAWLIVSTIFAIRAYGEEE